MLSLATRAVVGLANVNVHRSTFRDTSQKITENDRCRLAIYDGAHLIALEPGLPKPASGLVCCCTLVLKTDRNFKRKPEFPCHIASQCRHLTLGPIEVIWQTNNKNDGIIFRNDVSNLKQQLFPRRSLDKGKRAGNNAMLVADSDSDTLGAWIDRNDPSAGRKA